MSKWYVVRTSPRCELKALQYNTLSLGIDSYVPSIKPYNKSGTGSREKKSVLIPCYLFFRQHPIDFSLLNQNPYTKSVLRFNGKVISVTEEEIQSMKDHIENRFFKQDFQSGKVGSTIEIQKGIFSGNTAKIIEKRNNKIYLLLPSLQMRLILTLK